MTGPQRAERGVLHHISTLAYAWAGGMQDIPRPACMSLLQSMYVHALLE